MQKLLLFFILFNFCAAFAQKVDVSEPVDFARGSNLRLIGMQDDNFLVLTEGFSQNEITAFNDSLMMIWKKEINFKKKQVEILKILNSKDYFSIIYGFHQKGKTEIRIKRIGPDTSNLVDSLIYSFSSIISFNNLETAVSENKQQLVLYNYKQENKLDWISYNIKSFKLNNSREKDMNESNLNINFEQLLINNEGEVLLLTEFNNSRRKKNQHRIELNYFKNDSVLIYTIPLSGFVSISSLSVYDELNRQLIIGGLYSQNSIQTEGIFYARHNLKDSVFSKTIAFEQVLLRSITGEKKKKLYGIDHLDIRDVILRRDGGLILITEQFVNYTYTIQGNAYSDLPQSRRNDYLYENILVSSIHPDGTIHWQEVLYKNQNSEDDDGRYSSFFLLKTPSSLRFIYNENIRWTSNIFEYDVSAKGESKRLRLSEENDKENPDIMPEFKKAVQISANTMFAAHIRNNKIKLVRISY